MKIGKGSYYNYTKGPYGMQCQLNVQGPSMPSGTEEYWSSGDFWSGYKSGPAISASLQIFHPFRGSLMG